MYTRDFTTGVESLALADPTMPATPNPMDVTAFELWKLDIKDHQMKL